MHPVGKWCMSTYGFAGTLQGQIAPPEIRPAAVRAGAVVARRSARKRLFVAAPLPGFIGCALGTAGEGESLRVHRLGRSKQAHRRKLRERYYVAGMRLKDRHSRNVWEIFGFPVLRTGDTRGVRCGFIFAAHGLSHAAGESLEFLPSLRRAGHGYPSLD